MVPVIRGGADIMDRYPDIRYCILESGFGWLPFWGARMDDQSVYLSYALPKTSRAQTERIHDERALLRQPGDP
ncbi:MAG TPA: hypothetical protein VE131_15355 [Terriglobales bacterium]|nr:hypothetical protein [Terriglobales bacterium]